jgi:hypothetical protein
LNPINETPELNDIDKNYTSNYNEPVHSYTISGDYINYASIGVDSNEEDKQKQFENINYSTVSLEEEIVRNRIPTNGLKSSSFPENSSYSPVYDITTNNVSSL